MADKAEAGLQQRWAYGAAIETLGGTVERVTISHEGQTMAIAQVLTRRFAALVTRGPIWTCDASPEVRADARRMLRAALRSKGARILAITTLDGADTGWGVRLMTPATLACLRIDPPDRLSLHGKWRNRLKAAECAGLHIARLPNRFDQVRWLVEADRKQQKARGYRALPESFNAAWLHLNGKKVLTLAADLGQHPVAAMMFLLHGTTATYHIGWSNDEGRATHAHNLLLWQAASMLAAQGVRLLDLGTLDTENAPGLARFKLGTGARPQRLGPTWLSL